MPTKNRNNFLFDFLIDPKFRIGRHMLLIISLTFIVIGQSLFAFKDQLHALGTSVYWIIAINIIVLLAFAYFIFYLLAPRLLLKNKFIEYFLALIIGTALYLVFKNAVEYRTLLELGIERKINTITLLDWLSNSALYAVCMASSSVSVLIKQWLTDSDKIIALENTQMRSSVDNVKNQINPKSLSMILDYVSEKALLDPKAASNILFKLSDVLRYELYDCKREKVLLESDINFIDQYLSLEQLSSQYRFKHSINVTGKTNLFVAPFVFMPIIQRILGELPANININFNIDNNIVKFRCEALPIDLMQCDFSNEEQQMAILYKKKIVITKNAESVEMLMELC